MSANREQVGGEHYKKLTPQPWDVIEAWGLGFLDGNVVKYVSRWRSKNGMEDLLKARHYLNKLIEKERQKQSPRMDRPILGSDSIAPIVSGRIGEMHIDRSLTDDPT